MDLGENATKSSKRKAASTSSKVPLKRPRKNLEQSSVQYINPRLKDVQNDAGHPMSTAMASYAHSTILQLPLQPGVLRPDTLHQHYEQPSWTTTFPVPLIMHYSIRIAVVDTMLKLVKAKRKHLTTLERMKLYYNQKKNSFKKACKGLVGRLYPNMLIKLAEEMERDPDKWFSELLGYDYYFTGGNLAIVDRDQSKWMLNTVGEKMNAIEMVQVEIDGRIAVNDSDQMKRIQLSEDDGPVYEISWEKVEQEAVINY